MMTQISDAMVEAACKAHASSLYPGETIDFDRMEDELRDTRLWPAMRAALEAAIAAAEPPDAPGDAFDRALDKACYDTFRAGYDYARKMNPSLRAPHLICDILPGETHDARQHILDPHRQARRAGLRAIRETIYQESETCDRRSEFEQGYGDGVDWALDQIDAMLRGADGEMTLTNPESRDVVEKVIAETLRYRHPFGYPISDSPYNDADAILAALSAAGYEVVKRDQPLPPTPGPFNPFGKQDGE